MSSQGNFALVKTLAIRGLKWSAYAAAVWAFLFALMSFYWALGGTAGVETLGSAFSDPAVIGDPLFVAFVWITGFLKLLSGVLALALVQAWGRRIPRRFLLFAVWGIGIVLAVYGAALLVQHALMVTGVSDIPSAIGSMAAARWHLFVWDPYWLLGGILFLVAAWLSSRVYR